MVSEALRFKLCSKFCNDLGEAKLVCHPELSHCTPPEREGKLASVRHVAVVLHACLGNTLVKAARITKPAQAMQCEHKEKSA